jgi:hypothetical protein
LEEEDEMKVPNSVGWSETQRAIAQRICNLPSREEQAYDLLKWARSRLTYYGPSTPTQPVVEMIEQWLAEAFQPQDR